MTIKGICHLSQIPLRGGPQSSAEMVSQLLYGETYDVLEVIDDWYHIAMDYDGYKGYISKSSFFEYSPTDRKRKVLHESNISQASEFTNHTAVLSMGSEIIERDSVGRLYAADLAKTFLGTPYLWGGRHFSGIDCSGLVQVVYKTLGYKLPRDASQQQKVGKPVAFLELFVGDLVFFEKNARVMHVGMYLGSDKIVHSHGYVRIDTLTKKGIINSETNELTHHYHSAKRLA